MPIWNIEKYYHLWRNNKEDRKHFWSVCTPLLLRRCQNKMRHLYTHYKRTSFWGNSIDRQKRSLNKGKALRLFLPFPRIRPIFHSRHLLTSQTYNSTWVQYIVTTVVCMKIACLLYDFTVWPVFLYKHAYFNVI